VTVNTFLVRSALRARLQTTTGYPGDTRVAWENKDFVAPIDGAWLRESFLVSYNRKIGMEYEAAGLYQISVFRPHLEGAKQTDDLADTIRDHFLPGTLQIGTSQQYVSIDRSETGHGRPDLGAWWMTPTTVYWRVTRP
jgi:hypothetical protein